MARNRSKENRIKSVEDNISTAIIYKDLSTEDRAKEVDNLVKIRNLELKEKEMKLNFVKDISVAGAEAVTGYAGTKALINCFKAGLEAEKMESFVTPLMRSFTDKELVSNLFKRFLKK